MVEYIIIAIIVFLIIVALWTVNKQENLNVSRQNFEKNSEDIKQLFTYSDDEMILKKLYNQGWRVNLCASCNITRDSREQAKILYGDRIFNASFYEMSPIIVKDEDIPTVRWFNDNAVINRILSQDELNMLVNTNKRNLRNALVEKGWRYHYSALCEKCVDQMFYLYDKGEELDTLVVKEYQEEHNHGWNNIYSHDKHVGVLDLFDIYELL